jgi:hypothetical protein
VPVVCSWGTGVIRPLSPSGQLNTGAPTGSALDLVKAPHRPGHAMPLSAASPPFSPPTSRGIRA